MFFLSNINWVLLFFFQLNRLFCVSFCQNISRLLFLSVKIWTIISIKKPTSVVSSVEDRLLFLLYHKISTGFCFFFSVKISFVFSVQISTVFRFFCQRSTVIFIISVNIPMVFCFSCQILTVLFIYMSKSRQYFVFFGRSSTIFCFFCQISTGFSYFFFLYILIDFFKIFCHNNHCLLFLVSTWFIVIFSTSINFIAFCQ